MAQATIVQIPEELLFQIFTFLNINELLACFQVNTLWRKVALDKKLAPSILIFDRKMSIHDAKNLIINKTKLRNVDLFLNDQIALDHFMGTVKIYKIHFMSAYHLQDTNI